MASTKLGVYQQASLLIGNYTIVTTSDNTEMVRVFNAIYDEAVQFCLSQGWWKFISTQATQTTSASTLPGYSFKFTKPALWLRTHSVGIVTGTNFRLIDSREEGTEIHVKYASPVLRYIRNNGTTESAWPVPFEKVVAAYLALEACERINQSNTVKARVLKEFTDRLAFCRQSESERPPLALPEHAVERSTRHLLEQGFWSFSIKAVTPSTTTSPAAGFAKAYTIPADWLRTYDVMVQRGAMHYVIDWWDEGTKLSVGYGDYWTTVVSFPTIQLRYVSNTYLDPATWPETFAQAVDSYLQVVSVQADQTVAPDKSEGLKAQLDKVTDSALGKDRLPRPPALPVGVVDGVVNTTLEDGLWTFAKASVSLTTQVSPTPAPGFLYSFVKPTDWVRTIMVTRLNYPGDTDELAWKDESGLISANISPIYLTYLKNTAVDPQNWTEQFRAAVDAGIAYEAAKAAGDPQTATLYKLWKEICGQAKEKDQQNERHLIRGGQWNMARRGWYGRSRSEQGWRW